MIADEHTLRLLQRNRDPQVEHAAAIRAARPAQTKEAMTARTSTPTIETDPMAEAISLRFQNQARRVSHIRTQVRRINYLERLRLLETQGKEGESQPQ